MPFILSLSWKYIHMHLKKPTSRDSFLVISSFADLGRVRSGGYSWEFFVGVCRPVLQILTLKKCRVFHTRFQTWPLKFIPILRSGFYEIMSSLLRLEQQQNIFLKIHFEFADFSFFLIRLE